MAAKLTRKEKLAKMNELAKCSVNKDSVKPDLSSSEESVKIGRGGQDLEGVSAEKEVDKLNVGNSEGKIIKIDLNNIVRSENVRFAKPLDHVEKLKLSMEINGQLQPIGVQLHREEAGKYILVFGHCRFDAALLSDKFQQIEAKILPSDVNVAQMQVEENKERKDNSPWEEYYGRYRAIRFEEDRFLGISTDQLQKQLGYPPPMQSKVRKIGRVVESGDLIRFYSYHLSLNRILFLCSLSVKNDESLSDFIHDLDNRDYDIVEVNKWIDNREKQLNDEKEKSKKTKKTKGVKSPKIAILKPSKVQITEDNSGDKFVSLSDEGRGFSLPLSYETLQMLDDIKVMVEAGLKEEVVGD